LTAVHIFLALTDHPFSCLPLANNRPRIPDARLVFSKARAQVALTWRLQPAARHSPMKFAPQRGRSQFEIVLQSTLNARPARPGAASRERPVSGSANLYAHAETKNRANGRA